MTKSVQYINPKVSSLALYVSCILGCIGLVMIIRTTYDVCWYITVAPTAVAAYTNCYGLWSFCDDKGTCGKWFAGAYLAPHPMERMFGRIGMILSIILSSFGLLSLIFALPMVGLMALTSSTKRTLANTSGCLFISSGLIVFAVVLQHTINRARMVVAGEPTDLGSAIFSGFIGSGICLASGIVIFMGKWIVSLPYRHTNKHDNFIPVAGGANSQHQNHPSQSQQSYMGTGRTLPPIGLNPVPISNPTFVHPQSMATGYPMNTIFEQRPYPPQYAGNEYTGTVLSKSPTKVAFMEENLDQISKSQTETTNYSDYI